MKINKDNYEYTKEKIRPEFLKYDQKKMIEKWDLPCDEKNLYIDFAGCRYRLERNSGKVYKTAENGKRILEQEGNYEETLSIYDVLTNDRKTSVLSGEYCLVNSLPGTGHNSGVGENTVKTESMFIDRYPEIFIRACEEAGGCRISAGDIGMTVPLFPFLPVRLRFYHSDEEFPAQLSILFDKNTLEFIRYETVFYCTSCLLSFISGRMKRILCEKAFCDYTGKFDLSDVRIRLKYDHTFHVAENCENIARSLNLSREDVDLAWEIGMLHDIGRFRQMEKYGTFDDALSEDHAECGADLLFREHEIRKFIFHEKDDRLIELAVRLHNKYQLPRNLEEKEKTFCQIIRDADKIDILRVNATVGMENIYKISSEELYKSKVTKEVYQAFLRRHSIPKELHRTIADRKIGHFALVWDLVYPESRRQVREQGYLEQMFTDGWKEENTRWIFQQIHKILKDYLT